MFKKVVYLLLLSTLTIFSASIEDLFSNDAFSLPTALKGISFGMSTPEINSTFKGTEEFSYYYPAGYESFGEDLYFKFNADLFEDRLSYISFYSPNTFKEDPIQFFVKKLGTPITKTSYNGNPENIWYSKEKHIRVSLLILEDGKIAMHFHEYTALEDLLKKDAPNIPSPYSQIITGIPFSKAVGVDSLFSQSPMLNLRGCYQMGVELDINDADSTIQFCEFKFPGDEKTLSVLESLWGKAKVNANNEFEKYWRNENLSYRDKNGSVQKGMYVVYTSSSYSRHTLRVVPTL